MHARAGCLPMQQGGQIHLHTALQHQVDEVGIIKQKRVVIADREPLAADAVEQIIVKAVGLVRSICGPGRFQPRAGGDRCPPA